MNEKWNNLSPAVQRAVIAAGALDAGLRVAALVDVARRPASRVNGNKKAWIAALAILNSAGVVPISYFVRGRK